MKTEDYRSAAPKPANSGEAFYFPDAVIGALAKEASRAAPVLFAATMAQPEELKLLQMERPFIPHPVIGLAEAKKMIVAAFGAFNTELGERAQKILDDPARLDLKIVDKPDDVKRMQSRPAGSDREGGENKGSVAVIDYDFDSSIRAVIYLAHEVGHSIADDYQQEARSGFRFNPAHMEETQAYLLQNVMYDYLKAYPDRHIAGAAKRFQSVEMAHNIYDLPLSMAAKDALEAVAEGRAANPALIFGERFGANWEKFAADYEPARKIFDAISVLKPDLNDAPDPQAKATLEGQFNRFHARAPALLLASGIAAHLQAHPEQRQEIGDMLLGRHGPKTISDVLEASGIKTPEQLQGFVHGLTSKATSYLAGGEAPVASQFTSVTHPAKVAATRQA